MATSSASYASDSSAQVANGLNYHLGPPGHWLSIEAAAATLGLNPSTVRRHVREHKLPSKRIQRPQGYSLRVFLADDQVADSSYVQLGEIEGASSPPSSAQLAPSLNQSERAEAMATYGRTLIEPLVTELATVREQLVSQAETIGRLTAELGTLRASQTQQETSLPVQARDPITEPPMSSPEPFSMPIPTATPWWRRWIWWMVGIAL